MVISEKQKKEIQKEAKKILDSFSKKLEKIYTEKEPIIERDKCEREEGSEIVAELDRDIMFENAPDKDKNKGFIIGERKKW